MTIDESTNELEHLHPTIANVLIEVHEERMSYFLPFKTYSLNKLLYY